MSGVPSRIRREYYTITGHVGCCVRIFLVRAELFQETFEISNTLPPSHPCSLTPERIQSPGGVCGGVVVKTLLKVNEESFTDSKLKYVKNSCRQNVQIPHCTSHLALTLSPAFLPSARNSLTPHTKCSAFYTPKCKQGRVCAQVRVRGLGTSLKVRHHTDETERHDIFS